MNRLILFFIVRRKVTGGCDVSSHLGENFLRIPLRSFFATGCEDTSHPLLVDGIGIGLVLWMLFIGADEQLFLAKPVYRYANVPAGIINHLSKIPLAYEHTLPLPMVRVCVREDKQLAPFQVEPFAHHPVLNQESHHFLVDW